MKKAGLMFIVLMILLVLLAGPIQAVTIGGEFNLKSSYDFDLDDNVVTTADLELNFSRSSFTEAFEVTIGVKDGWPEGETEVSLRDAYFDYYGENYDLRAGKQLVSWGTAAGYNPTDNINPLNLDDPTDDKDSLLMVRGDYYFDHNYRLTGILVPYHQPPLTGTMPLPDTGVEMPQKAGTELEIEETDYGVSSLEYGLRFSGRGIAGYDFSFSLYHGHENFPTLRYEETPKDLLPESSYYQKFTVVGADLATDFKGVGFWAEGAYMIPEYRDSYGSLVIGADYNLPSGQLILGQLIYQQDREGEDNFIIHQAVEGLFADHHQARIAGFYNLSSDSYLIRPEVEFSLADAVKFKIDYTYQSGMVLSQGQSFVVEDRNEISAALSYYF